MEVEEKKGIFHTWYDRICQTLKDGSQLQEISAAFGQQKSDEERFSFVWDLPCLHETIQVEPSLSLKSSETSTKLRKKGNQLFQKKFYAKALEAYNESVIIAPPVCDKPGESDLSLALANRSAVLFHMQEYFLCLTDIEQSLENNYPDELKYKLEERKGKCYSKLKEKGKACESFHIAKQLVEISTADSKKKQSLIQEIEKQLKQLDISSPDSEGPAADSVDDSMPMPVLSHGQSQKYLSASSALDVTTAPTLGRFPVATCDIQVGDTLVIEKPFASVLLKPYNVSHCHSCFKQLVAPIPCSECSTVRYCSQKCKQSGWLRFHQFECPYLDTIQQSGIGGMGHLALRVVLVAGYEFLLGFKELVQHKEVGDCCELDWGLDEKGQYRSDNYTTIYNLVTHSEDRAVNDLFRRTIMSVFLLKCLQKSPFFQEKDVGKSILCYFGGLILRHLQNLPCNAHEISELELDPDNVATSTTKEIGAAIYAMMSLFNHSCDPAVTRNFLGDVCIVRAIRNVTKGSEVSDNYGALCAISATPERRAKLKEQYYFICQCQPCAENWLQYDQLPNTVPIFKCGSCAAPLLLNAMSGVASKCIKCNKEQNLTAKVQVLKRSEQLFSSAMEKLLRNADAKTALPIFLSHIRLLEKLVVRPWQDYNNCQEAIKQCYSIMGNCSRV
ncbi:SET and MYND domain-containing protein 4 [Lingula anatina]|uniref:Protein-lysine N-methyltransferase SMYD4 n=1 Tax=Lingula anatina TaxID=7574 RepID=A0A1S3JUV2_LINAN|nr:SET and MYND domain-containing protein 4 [Lingula anatina]XP_013414150.1 SET and MYND domain-containing protein 4 [Lingula anatina]|eukprot:XP_013414149.1 SET and MYND domain-containing protein 4 [Lingula anatina]